MTVIEDRDCEQRLGQSEMERSLRGEEDETERILGGDYEVTETETEAETGTETEDRMRLRGN